MTGGDLQTTRAVEHKVDLLFTLVWADARYAMGVAVPGPRPRVGKAVRPDAK
jgi:hypothetical protein